MRMKLKTQIFSSRPGGACMEKMYFGGPSASAIVSISSAKLLEYRRKKLWASEWHGACSRVGMTHFKHGGEHDR